ncbi:flavin adenine dinucleotide pyrophosphatase KNAG_0F01750 [Huiozyma naganishii CBS 8797]|uniref:MoaB/Mog domain-containing protein n=1 Tax=Huiozyma naganishii (strain ATCC MYA-139 / BCRC 22969 / CBS 8797 / KCTC 17520 / NBRC 10181 / NCYC 3082 / Yp74L-3) TaxID=1071383 RepID=J7RMP4_HUIN7|nr:hypothetical protein KNAG_0F01750 [Kazachstania naganishii CBS 8797]CCK70843.1 hypothetical protein KNAG_0F01750 [Kazachstania naganishii CBS 8797]
MSRIRAACVIIGDEVLNGKITDTNSSFFAKYCFKNGIKLEQIVTIGDNEEQIMDTMCDLKNKYQFIVTSGGIGSTHDDITYESIAKSFNLPCSINEELKKRMQERSHPENRLHGQALHDYYKMATLPSGPTVKNYYIADDLWVPVCCIDTKVFIFPGIPQLFERMINSMTPILKNLFHMSDNDCSFVRYYVKTPLSESQIAHTLKLIQEESTAVSQEIKIGSYPHFGMGFNTISILGEQKDDEYLKRIVTRAVNELQGEELSGDMEEKYSDER